MHVCVTKSKFKVSIELDTSVPNINDMMGHLSMIPIIISSGIYFNTLFLSHTHCTVHEKIMVMENFEVNKIDISKALVPYLNIK